MGPQSAQRAKDQGESEPGALLASEGGRPAAGVLNTGLMPCGVTLQSEGTVGAGWPRGLLRTGDARLDPGEGSVLPSL